MTLNKPVVGMAATPSGKGYWLVASDGGLFSYGNAGFFGSNGGASAPSPFVGTAQTPTGKGYWLATGAGKVQNYGDAGALGSVEKVNLPVVGLAALR